MLNLNFQNGTAPALNARNMNAIVESINTLGYAVGGPNVASTVSAMTDASKVYVYTGSETGYTAGNWYYYNGSAWVSGGVYQATAVETDTTLTMPGEPADAKATGDAVTELKSAINSFGEYIDGRIRNPQFELGDIYVNSSGAIAYYSSSKRARTKKNTSINLKAGTIVSLSSYDGYRFMLYRSNGDGTYSSTGGWKQENLTIETAGDYVILISYYPEADITSLNALVNLLVIKYDSKFDKTVEDLANLGDAAEMQFKVLDERRKAIDYINSSEFELGDLYVNDTGAGTYYDSTSRLRTIKNSPVRLRAGDVVGLSDYSNAVYLTRKKIGSGQYQSMFENKWMNHDGLISADGEYEFVLKYPTEATITNPTELSSLFVIKEKYGIVKEDSNIENLIDVYKNELQITIDTARTKTTSRGLMFGVITDTHLDNKHAGYYNQTMENLERLNNGLQFNGIFHLGDIINGYDTADVAKFHLQYAVDRLLKINPQNTYITVGNHDNNNGAGDAQRLSDRDLYSYLQRYNEHYVNRSMDTSGSVYESQTSNYYVDYPTLKIRMIMFDSCYYSGGFAEDMILWMTDLLASTPNDYHFVFFTHESTEAALNGGHDLGNATTFKNLLAQYKDRIYCYIHGHSHYDYVGYDNGFAQVALCCAVPDQPSSSVPSGGVQPTRTIGTVTQDCISVIIILPEEQKVELVRFGAGDDRTIPFRQ